MERASHLLLTYLINAVWQVAVICAVATLCSLLLRRTSAKARHTLWLMALLLSALLPMWSLRDVVNGPRASAVKADTLDSTLRVTAVANKTTPKPGRFRFPRLSPSHAALWLLWTVAGCYFAFLLYRAMRLYRAGQRTWTLSRTKTNPLTAGMLADIVQRYSHEIRLRRIPSLHLTDGVGPVTIGIRRPLLLVPAVFAESASEQEMTSAVCHELAHIRRHDFLLNLICELMWLPISFHPAAALIKARIDGTRELACDEIAARVLSAPALYARSLVSIAKAMSSSVPVRQLSYGQGLFDSERLEERIMNLVGNRKLITGPLAHGLAVLTTSLLAVASVSAAAYSVQIAEPSVVSGTVSRALVATQENSTRRDGVAPHKPIGTNRSIGIIRFTLLGGSEVPDAQELLAKALRSRLYDSNFRSEIPERVQAFYCEYGYAAVKIAEASFKEAGPSAVDITITVNAGKQYRFEDIRFEGDHALPESEIRALFPFKPGDVYKESAINAGYQALQRLYREKGQAAKLPMLISGSNETTATVQVTLGADGARSIKLPAGLQ